MKIIFILTGMVIFYFIYGFYLAQGHFVAVPNNLKRENPPGFYDYKGISNVQTDLSSGSSDPIEVIGEARKAGLDFIILTDVNQPEKLRGLDAYHGNMLVMAESEYSFLDMRLLHFSGEKDQAPTDLNDARLYFTDILSQPSSQTRDNVVLLARPFNNGSPTWTGDFPVGLDGIEIVNPKSISQQAWVASKLNVFWSLVCYPFNPNLAFLRLFNEPSQETALWDQLNNSNKKKHVFGFAGADASARAIPFASYLMKFPSYEKSFEITTNHILTESELNGLYQKDRQTIETALKRGQFYMAIDLLGDPKGFNAYIQEKDRMHLMGSTTKYNRNLRLVAKLPTEPADFYEIIVFKNGDRDLTANQPEINYEIKGPGVYRIAVRVAVSLPIPDGKKWITWIYTNPFFVN